MSKAGLGDKRARLTLPTRGKPIVARRSDASGLGARDLALSMLNDVLDHRRALDDAVARSFASAQGLALEPRDRGLARLIAATVLRRRGVIEAVLGEFMEKPLAPKFEDVNRIMQLAAAQILYLQTPPHAAVSVAVAQARRRPATQHFSKLVNAIMRRTAMEGPALRDQFDDFELNFPPWLRTAMTEAYGDAEAKSIAIASLREAPLDLTIKCRQNDDGSNAHEHWAARLGGALLATGSVRLPSGGRVSEREGYTQGAWWVQDAAAALPVHLLGHDLTGLRAVDLCAAPGGKTAQLAARGARVTAVDISNVRLQRIAENLQRLGLSAEIIEADAMQWQPDHTFDAVLLDAPCSATGTIRRHPDILHLKDQKDLAGLIRLQKGLLDRAAALVRPGGTLVYCTCSLLPAEGEHRIQGFLAKHPEFARNPIMAADDGIEAEWITPEGDLRTLPCLSPPGDPENRGMDGFFAARLIRSA